MITPTKYMNLDYSLLNVSAILVKEFSKQSIISYDELLQITVRKIGNHAMSKASFSFMWIKEGSNLLRGC